MILDGKKLADGILARASVCAGNLPRRPRVLAIVANESAATMSYMKVKERAAEAAGCEFYIERFSEDASLDELHLAISTTEADSIIVQLPLPDDLHLKSVCDAIPVEKDADVLSTVARMKFDADEGDALIPPVAGALAEILQAGGVDVHGKKAAVVGMGWLVGRPCAAWLAHAGAEVTHLASQADGRAALASADIVVSGAGSPHFVKPDMLKDGCVLIDAGTSESAGKIAGDADPSCAEKCSLFTPVPGGVGPVAVAKLFENVVALAERESHA